MDFHGLTRRELQSLCKNNGIPANMTNVAMADALSELEKVEGIEGLFSSGECGDSESVNDSSQKSDFTSPFVCRSNRARNVTERGSTAAKPMRSSRCTTKKSLTMDTEKENTPANVGATSQRRKSKKEDGSTVQTAVRRSARLASKYGKSSREEGTDTLKVDLPAVKYCENVNLKESLDNADDAISSVTDADTLDTKCPSVKGEAEVVSEHRQELSIDKEAAVDTIAEVEILFEEENGEDFKMKGEGFGIQIETPNDKLVDCERVEDDLTKPEEKDVSVSPVHVGVEFNKKEDEKNSASLEMDLTKHEEKDVDIEFNKEGAEINSASLEMDLTAVEYGENDPSEKGHELSGTKEGMDFKEANDVIAELAGYYIQNEVEKDKHESIEADASINNTTNVSDEVNVKEGITIPCESSSSSINAKETVTADEFEDSSNEPPHSVLLTPDNAAVDGVSEEKEEEASSLCISSMPVEAVNRSQDANVLKNKCGAKSKQHHVKGNPNLTGSAEFDFCLPIPKDLLIPKRESAFIKTNRNEENKENKNNNDNDNDIHNLSMRKLRAKVKELSSKSGPKHKKSSSGEDVLQSTRSPLQPLEKNNMRI